jgi:putative DNA primase/helicase
VLTSSINHAHQDRTGPFWEAPKLVKAGYWVFPVDDKTPIRQGSFYGSSNDMSEVAAWIEQGHGAHDLAIGTGFYSRVVVIDADDKEAYDRMVAKYGPPTYTTKRGGHWLFKHPRNGKVVSNKIAPGLDRKGDGGIVVVPPSKGRKWTDGIPDIGELPVLPREFWSKGNPAPGRSYADVTGVAGPGEIGDEIADGNRNGTLTSLAGTMRRRGMGEAEIYGALEVTNRLRCKPPLHAEEVRRICASVAQYEPSDQPWWVRVVKKHV